MSKPLNVNVDRFEAEVIKSPVPTLVDFWAPWCMPCKLMGPILEDLAQSLGDRVKVVKVDVEDRQNLALAQMYQIRGIPSMKIFKGGSVVEDFVGMRSAADLKEALERHV